MSPGLQSRWQRWGIPGIIASGLLVSDQLSKFWTIQHLGPIPGSRQIFVIDDWFSLIYVANTGIAFGLLPNLSRIFIVTSLLISAGVIYAYLFYLPNHSCRVKVSIGLIIGGALGNVLDRIQWRHVIDFIKIGWWPAFNLADIGISIGVLILAVYLLFIDDCECEHTMPQDDALLTKLLYGEPDGSPVESEEG